MRNVDHYYWLLLPLLCALVVVAYIRVSDSQKIGYLFRYFFSTSVSERPFLDDSAAAIRSSFLLTINGGLVISTVVTYLCLVISPINISFSSIALWGAIFSGVFLVYWIKNIVLKILGLIVERDAILALISAYDKYLLQVLGVALLPFLLFLNFSSDYSSNFTYFSLLLYVVAVIVLFFYLTRLVKVYRVSKQIKISPYYLFLYFCTLEILPIVVTTTSLGIW